MSHLKRLLLPIGLAVAAGVGHYIVLTQAVIPRRFIAAADDLAEGQPLLETSLRTVAISGDLDALRVAAVPAEQMKAVDGRKTARALRKGDLVLYRDLAPPPPILDLADGEKGLPVSLEGVTVEPSLLVVGQKIGFLIAGSRGIGDPVASKAASGTNTTYVGPFRLVSVGRRLRASESPGDAQKLAVGDSRTITIAVRLEGDDGVPERRRLVEQSSKLFESIGVGQGGMAGTGGNRRIVAILLDPVEQLVATGAEEEPENKDVGRAEAKSSPTSSESEQ